MRFLLGLFLAGLAFGQAPVAIEVGPATAGAGAFMASDAILAFDLFKNARLFGSARLTAWAVWFL